MINIVRKNNVQYPILVPEYKKRKKSLAIFTI